MGVSGWVFLLVSAYPGCPGPKAVKQLCVCVCYWLVTILAEKYAVCVVITNVSVTETVGLITHTPLRWSWPRQRSVISLSLRALAQQEAVSRISTEKSHLHSAVDGWLGSGVVSVLDSGVEGPGFKSQPRCCRVTVLGKLFTPIVPLFTKQRKLVAALLRVAGVTAGQVESNGSLLPGLWVTSPAGWLPRTGISSGTLRSVIEYGLPVPFL